MAGSPNGITSEPDGSRAGRWGSSAPPQAKRARATAVPHPPPVAMRTPAEAVAQDATTREHSAQARQAGAIVSGSRLAEG